MVASSEIQLSSEIFVCNIETSDDNHIAILWIPDDAEYYYWIIPGTLML
jgi:hypothetical protein